MIFETIRHPIKLSYNQTHDSISMTGLLCFIWLLEACEEIDDLFRFDMNYIFEYAVEHPKHIVQPPDGRQIWDVKHREGSHLRWATTRPTTLFSQAISSAENTERYLQSSTDHCGWSHKTSNPMTHDRSSFPFYSRNSVQLLTFNSAKSAHLSQSNVSITHVEMLEFKSTVERSELSLSFAPKVPNRCVLLTGW